MVAAEERFVPWESRLSSSLWSVCTSSCVDVKIDCVWSSGMTGGERMSLPPLRRVRRGR